MITFAKEFNTPEPILSEMYWYDVIIMMQRYNELMDENKSDNQYTEQIQKQQDEYKNQMNNIKMPSFNATNINSVMSGIKMPKF